MSLGTLISSRFHFWWSCCNVWCLGFLSSLYIPAINLLSHSVAGLFTRKPVPSAARQLFIFMTSYLSIVRCVPCLERSYPVSLSCIQLCFLLAVSEFQVLCCCPWAILSWYVCSWKDRISLFTCSYPVFPVPFAQQAASYPVCTFGSCLRWVFWVLYSTHWSMCLFHAGTMLFYTMIMSGMVTPPALFSLLKIAFAMILFPYTYLALVF